MKKTGFVFLLLAAVMLSAFVGYSAIDWQIGAGYAVRFSTKGVTGAFTSMSGVIRFDPTELQASKFDVKVDAASITTGIGLKDRHARGENWFDVEHFPEIRFTSDEIKKAGPAFETKGSLYLHGVAKQIAIPFSFANDTFKGSFEVNRLDYKLGSSEGMQGKVGETLQVQLSVPVKQ